MKDRKEEEGAKLLKWSSITLALGVASILYRVLVLNHLEQTSLLFMGLPLIISIALGVGPRAKSITGRIMKGITLAMFLFGILFIEGIICILMASPLFYLVGAIVGYSLTRMQKKRDGKVLCSVVGVIALLSFEGAVKSLSFPREETIIVTQEVAGSTTEAWHQLENGPEFDLKELPGFLQLGFPLPQTIEGQGLELGTQWRIHFAGGEGKPGDLVVEVSESSEDHVVLTCVQDQSHIAHWLDWKQVEWHVKEVSPSSSEVQMTIHYTRLLDPAWYFKPIERYGVRLAGEYFLSQCFPAS